MPRPILGSHTFGSGRIITPDVYTARPSAERAASASMRVDTIPPHNCVRAISSKWVQVAEEIAMVAYWIGEHAIADPIFEEYLRKVLPIIERFGGRYLTGLEAHEVLDGDWRPIGSS